MADPDGLVSREFRAPLLRAKPGRASGVLTIELRQTLQGGTAALDPLMNGNGLPVLRRRADPRVFNAIVSASYPAD
jgi:hypothetical protein